MTTPQNNVTATNMSIMGGDPDGNMVITVQKAFELAGGGGTYQKRLVYLLSIQRIFIGFLFLSFPYLFQEPPFRCRNSIDEPWTECRPTPENCMRIIEPIPGAENTMVTEFGLYCEKKGLISLSLTIWLATMCVGIFALASLPDTLGRKKALIYSNIALTAMLFLTIVIPNAYYSLIMIGFLGLPMGPNISYTFMYLNEISDSEYRQIATIMVNAIRSVGQMALGPLCALISNDWRLLIILYLAIPIGAAIPFLYNWVDEPPAYLVSRGQFAEAKATINTIAKVNGREIKDFMFIEDLRRKTASPSILRRYPSNVQHRPSAFGFGSIRKSIKLLQQVRTYHYPDLIKYHSIKTQVLILTVVSIVQFFVNNAMTWAVPSIQAPTSWVTFAISLGELLSCLFGAFLYIHLKRRPLYILCHTLLVLSCLPFTLLDAPEECLSSSTLCWQSYMQITLVVVAKCVISVVSMLFFIYAAEVFPTPVRSLGTGLVSVLARSGSILSPMAIEIFMEEDINPMTALGVLGIPAIIVCFYLKETKGQPLPDEIEEEKQLEMRLLDPKNNN